MTEAEHKSGWQITNYTPYLALTGELWGLFCEDLVEIWSRYNGTALYLCSIPLIYVCLNPYSNPHVNFHQVPLRLPSLPCMFFLFGWPPCRRSDMTLVEVSQPVYYVSGMYGCFYINEPYVYLIWYLYKFCWINFSGSYVTSYLFYHIIIPYRTLIHSSLTHWGRVTHTCVGNLTTIGSDNGLSPGRRQAIIWTNAGILSIVPLGTNFNEILIEIHTFSLKKMHLKMSSAKWRPFCLGLNVLIRAFAYPCMPINMETHSLLVTLCEEKSTGHRGFPITKGQWRGLWCYRGC